MSIDMISQRGLISQEYFFNAAISIGLLVGLFSSIILIFGPMIIDDISSSRNWSLEKTQEVNRNMLKLSAVLIIFFISVGLDNHLM